jgi:hypothetical protein
MELIMKLKKIIAAVAAAAMALSLSVVASAETNTVHLIAGKSDWSNAVSEGVEITADGTYTFTVDVTGATGFNSIYFNSGDGTTKEAFAVDTVVATVDSFEFSGDSGTLAFTPKAEKAGTTAIVAGGVLDIPFINGWAAADAWCEIPDSVELSGNTYLVEGYTTLTVTVTFAGVSGDAPAAATTAPATGNAPMALAATVVVIAGASMVATRKRK